MFAWHGPKPAARPTESGLDRRGRPNPGSANPSAAPAPLRFEAVVEEWRMTGELASGASLTDCLNRSAALPVADVCWAPLDGSAPLSAAAGIKRLDLYSIVAIVTTAPSPTQTLPGPRQSYVLDFELSPVRASGTVALCPGQEIEQLIGADHSIFISLANGEVSLDGVQLGPIGASTILLNRAYLERIDQAGDEPNRLRWRRVEDWAEVMALSEAAQG